jgi:hypothetical protein
VNKVQIDGRLYRIMNTPRDGFCDLYCRRPCGDCFDLHNCPCDNNHSVMNYWFCLDDCAARCGC